MILISKLTFLTDYWHFLLAYSVLSGLGGSLINAPTLASIGHFFLRKRGNATGIAMTSGSLGGVVFPLMLEKLIPQLGFAWATRVLGFILVFLLAVSNLLTRSRLPPKKGMQIMPDLTVLKDLKFSLLTFGIFLLEWGIFVPLAYITSYAVAHGASTAFGYQIIALVNAGSFFGRLGAGYISDCIGRLNTLICTITLCVITILALWLPAGDSKPLLVFFAVTFGFASGSNLSLAPVCVGQMCATENYGRYVSTCWMIVSFG